MTAEGRTNPTRIILEDNRPRAIVRHQCRLEVVRGPDKGRRIDVDKKRIRIGTGTANDLVLADPAVSRLQAEIDLGEDGYRLKDLGSTNGTWVGALRIFDAMIEPGTRLRMGHTEVRFEAAAEGALELLDEAASFGGLCGESVVMRSLFAQLRRVAPTDATVLLAGETGTGKDLAAESIVMASPRRDAPFVVVDCGALAPTLVESELFGHEKGAFTGALDERAGSFELADGGTLFLDEVGEMPLDLQPKLLRALEAHEVRRIGAKKPLKVDVRVIAATNRPLAAEVNRGGFRADLYYRLAVVELELPPLRERLSDIPLLVARILEDCGRRSDEISAGTMAELLRYQWPGNVRELRNFIERAVMLDESVIPSDGAASLGHGGRPRVDIDAPFRVAKEAAISAFERAYVEALLTRSGGNIAAAARMGRMDRMYLHRLVQRYGIDRVKGGRRG